MVILVLTKIIVIDFCHNQAPLAGKMICTIYLQVFSAIISTLKWKL